VGYISFIARTYYTTGGISFLTVFSLSLVRKYIYIKEFFMSNKVEIDPEKMFNRDKTKLGEQSEFVKKAIEPLLTLGFASFSYKYDYNYGSEIRINDPEIIDNPYEYEDSLIAVNKKNPDYIKNHILKYYEVGNLYDYLSGYGSDDKSAIEKFKSVGIEGERSMSGKVTVYDENYIKSLNRIDENDRLE
jgi:hypothetical protein